jgi:Hypothetical glycosyl hydrolase 6
MTMNRRTFNKLAGLGAIHALSSQSAPGSQPFVSAVNPAHDSAKEPHATAHIPARAVEWPSQTYRRLLVDTHVPDWDSSLLASFDAADYVSTIADAGFQSLMQYANSHVGLCLWRTKIGQIHRNMQGRDYFGEVMEQCHRRGLHRVAYYSLIFDDWAYRTYPDWRIVSADDSDAKRHDRAGAVCINSLYPEHAIACIKELVAGYDFESIFFDMTFWPTICYCSHCIARYWKEQNAEPPRIVDWKDPQWRTFQKSRERWMREFALSVTQAVKQVRPIQVYHQFGTFFAPWTVAVSLEQNEASDFAAGDFYGGAAQFSIVCKAYLSLTRKRPFEFMTSRTLNLNDFETTKPFEQLALESMIPMIHSSACLLIDAIKPTGALNPRAYEYLSQINALRDAYEPFLGGELLADVAIYYDKNSMYDPDAHGITAADAAKNTWSVKMPHLDAAVGAARFLRESHIPFGVVTNASLDQLSSYRAVILPNVLEMTLDQAAVFRQFVSNGGVLFATGVSSMSAPGDKQSGQDGLGGQERFLLEDVLGVRYLGRVGGRTTYLSPTNRELIDAIWPQENMGFSGPMVKVQAAPAAEVLATITLPFVDPEAGTALNTRFAQIWSNPPASRAGQDPGIVMNSFGKGSAIWTATSLESRSDAVNAGVFTLLLKRALQPPYRFEADTDRAVEVTLFHQRDRQRLLVGMLNLQTQVPTIPVTATIRIQIPPGHRARRASLLPEQKDIAIAPAGLYITLQVPAFNLVSMALIDYV